MVITSHFVAMANARRNEGVLFFRNFSNCWRVSHFVFVSALFRFPCCGFHRSSCKFAHQRGRPFDILKISFLVCTLEALTSFRWKLLSSFNCATRLDSPIPNLFQFVVISWRWWLDGKKSTIFIPACGSSTNNSRWFFTFYALLFEPNISKSLFASLILRTTSMITSPEHNNHQRIPHRQWQRLNSYRNYANFTSKLHHATALPTKGVKLIIPYPFQLHHFITANKTASTLPFSKFKFKFSRHLVG